MNERASEPSGDEMTYRRGPVTVTAKWDAGKLVDLHLSADGGGEITREELERALLHVDADLRADRKAPARIDTPRERTPEDKERAEQWKTLRDELTEAFKAGKSSPVYLATLAKAYAFLAERGGVDVMKWQRIGTAVDRSPNTAKMHLVEARKGGYLTDAGEMTDKARKALSDQ
ncbi:hypothetical protein [Streptomyces formicae]